ncbi:glycosyltransferase family 2 protein [Marinilactibacillus kalidii]|uniref:glycosyltransferase family 2 protein n=1 Tax=Marinilactibacillus kalidii TaxID=2820274 RepID=UPI001ABE583A|nr:glycosyltransferase family 2 protein [Marinilactibacillus kalidii]
MKRPFFTLVMPVYNAQNKIIDTLTSIASQTFKDFEVILINDGSTDSSREMIETFIADKNQFKLINIDNSGPGSARNYGIKQANGTYMIFVDADDKLVITALEDRYAYIADSKTDLLISSYVMKVLDEGEVVNEKVTEAVDRTYLKQSDFKDDLFNLMEKQLLYVVWNKVYKVDIIKKNNISFPPYRSCEDRLFNLAYFDSVQTVKLVKEILYEYYFDGRDGLTNKHFPNKFQTFVEFYEKCLEISPKDNRGFSALFLKGVMSSIIPIHSVSTLTFREKRNYIKSILHNDRVLQASEDSLDNSLMRKVLKNVFKIKSVILMYLTSWILYKISNTSPRFIEKIKGNF